jgi:hypothetical protein
MIPLSVIKAAETFGIGLAVVVVSSIIQGLTNYHPTGTEGALWGVGGVAIIGALRGLLSWLIVKQKTPPAAPVPLTITTTTEKPS